MKKYLTTIQLFCIVQLLQAQQLYNPFVSRFTYQYLNESKDTVSSLRCIETDQVNGDSVFTFNKVLYKNDSKLNIFGKKLISKSNGAYHFVINDKDTLAIRTLTSLGEEWLFCKSPRTVAKNIGKSLETFLGVSDSVLTILTDKGFEIKISKNYGMVRTINMSEYVARNFIKPLYIDAIPEAKLGSFANDPLVLFDYNIGELFVWKEEYSNPWLHLITTTYKRYKVINKVLSTNKDTVTYTFLSDSKIYSRKYININDNTYTEKNEYKLGENIEKKYFRINNTIKDDTEKYSLLSNEIKSKGVNEVILYDTFLKRYTIKIASLYWGLGPITDIYKTGIGVTFSYNCMRWSLNGQCEITNSSELLCYAKDREVNKDCNIYDELLNSYNAAESKFSVLNIFPNPASSEINILPIADVNLQRIQVINSLGAMVIEKAFSNTLDIQSISDGIYTVIVYSADGGYFMKKIVKMSINK